MKIDGVVYLYRAMNTAENGKMPKLTYSLLTHEYYSARTVGFNRYYTAQQNGARIDAMLRIPRRYDLEQAQSDIVAVLAPFSHTDGSVYRIIQIQQIDDSDNLPATDITLERWEGIDADDIIQSCGCN